MSAQLFQGPGCEQLVNSFEGLDLEDLELPQTLHAEDLWLASPAEASNADLVELRRQVAQQGLEQAQQRQELAQQRLHQEVQDDLLPHHEKSLAMHAALIADNFISLCRVEPDDAPRRQRLAELAASRRVEGEALRTLVLEADLGNLSRQVFSAVDPATIMAGLTRPATDPHKQKVWTQEENLLLATLVHTGVDDAVAGRWLGIDKKRVCRQRLALGLDTRYHFGGMRGETPATPKDRLFVEPFAIILSPIEGQRTP